MNHFIIQTKGYFDLGKMNMQNTSLPFVDQNGYLYLYRKVLEVP